MNSNKHPQRKAVTPENVGTVGVGMIFTNVNYGPLMAKHATNVTNKTTSLPSAKANPLKNQ